MLQSGEFDFDSKEDISNMPEPTDLLGFLAKKKGLTPGTDEYAAFVLSLKELGIDNLALPTVRASTTPGRETAKSFTLNYIEERGQEFKPYIAFALEQKLNPLEPPQFLVVEHSIVEEYMKHLTEVFNPTEDEMAKILKELRKIPRKKSEERKEEDKKPTKAKSKTNPL